MVTTTWQPIQDLPQNWEEMHTDQLRSLSEVWQRQRTVQLEDSNVLQEFNERLSRQWAIETGIIEGLYTIDRGTTRVLIEHGIVEKNIPHSVTNRPLTLVAMLHDHEMVLEGAFDFVQQRRTLSTSYIKEIHAVLTQHQPTTEAVDSMGRIATVELRRGEWKLHPNNPTRPDGLVHSYAPPEHVAAEMDRLVQMHLAHQAQGVPPEIEAAWLHHRFTQIHPFQDGNGRVARVLASLVLLRAGWFPLIVDRDQRVTYIDVLEAADRGTLKPLIDLFTRIQAKDFFDAFVQLDSVSHPKAIKQASKQGFILLEERETSADTSASALADYLRNYAYDQLVSEADNLTTELVLRNSAEEYTVAASRSGFGREEWVEFALETAIVADETGYRVNTDVYREGVTLSFTASAETKIRFSFHGFGHEFNGLMAVSAYMEMREKTDESSKSMRWTYGPYRLINHIFLFAGNEEPVAAKIRFQAWFEEALTVAIARWQQQL